MPKIKSKSASLVSDLPNAELLLKPVADFYDTTVRIFEVRAKIDTERFSNEPFKAYLVTSWRGDHEVYQSSSDAKRRFVQLILDAIADELTLHQESGCLGMGRFIGFEDDFFNGVRASSKFPELKELCDLNERLQRAELGSRVACRIEGHLLMEKHGRA
jgi:hypothetical protein